MKKELLKSAIINTCDILLIHFKLTKANLRPQKTSDIVELTSISPVQSPESKEEISSKNKVELTDILKRLQDSLGKLTVTNSKKLRGAIKGFVTHPEIAALISSLDVKITFEQSKSFFRRVTLNESVVIGAQHEGLKYIMSFMTKLNQIYKLGIATEDKFTSLQDLVDKKANEYAMQLSSEARQDSFLCLF